MRLFTKERVVSGINYGIIYPSTFFLPGLIAMALGVSEVKSFCGQHSDICSQYASKKPLDQALESATYSNTHLAMYVLTAIAQLTILVIFLGAVGIVCGFQKNRRGVDQNKQQSLLPLITTGSLQKDFNWSKFKLHLMFSSSVTALLQQRRSVLMRLVNMVCVTSAQAKQACDISFPNATKDESELVSNLADKMYYSMIFAGSALLCLTWGLLGLSIYAKRQMSRDANTHEKADSAQEDIGDDSGAGAVVSLSRV